MNIADILNNACSTLANRWIHTANAVYPFATTGFLHTQPDPFANPVGQRSRELAPLLLRAVAGLPYDETAFQTAMEEFTRVRAMQDMPANVTLQVMFAYKHIVRAYLKDQNISTGEFSPDALHALDERSDNFALLAFDIYARQREAFFEVRLHDIQRRYSQILRLAQRHGLAETITETGDTDPPSRTPSPGMHS